MARLTPLDALVLRIGIATAILLAYILLMAVKYL